MPAMPDADAGGVEGVAIDLTLIGLELPLPSWPSGTVLAWKGSSSRVFLVQWPCRSAAATMR
jgi:hypothetical protein